VRLIGAGPDATPFKKPITINNSQNSNTLTDYQVLVTLDTQSLISAQKMRSDCGDIRFTDSDGTTLLNYWLEGGCNTTSTRIWVKVPSIPASSTKTIYIYYGKPSASSASNGNATFEFFDDFEDGIIDTTKWIISNPLNATIDETGGQLRMLYTGTAAATSYVQSTQSVALSNTLIMEWNGTWLVTPTAKGAGASFWVDDNNFEQLNRVDTGWGGSPRLDLNVKIAGTNYNTNYAVVSNPMTGYFYLQHLKSTTRGYESADNVLLTLNYGLSSGNAYIRLYIASWGNYGTNEAKAWYDYIRVRKYASPEPTTSVGTEEAYYSPSGTFTSSILDAGQNSNFTTLLFSATTSASTTIKF